ncbi:hypothetical protein PL75_03640 [Neisseria arctica]|uniref:Uncharacterized protein n=1 Tax=Neisseria arctica TaxID=1470200 RepID=A0A0J0YT68_9NEIS|nr:hypothetical protein PL75_03640 [Neisseria arctica]
MGNCLFPKLPPIDYIFNIQTILNKYAIGFISIIFMNSTGISLINIKKHRYHTVLFLKKFILIGVADQLLA